jgi:hypothetical protein
MFRLFLPPAFTLASCLAYSTLKMETVCFSEMSVDFQRTIRRYTPEDSTLQLISCLPKCEYQFRSVLLGV